MSNVASAYSLKYSVRGTTFSSFMEFMVCVLSCGCVRRMCSCEKIAHKRSDDIRVQKRAGGAVSVCEKIAHKRSDDIRVQKRACSRTSNAPDKS